MDQAVTETLREVLGPYRQTGMQIDDLLNRPHMSNSSPLLPACHSKPPKTPSPAHAFGQIAAQHLLRLGQSRHDPEYSGIAKWLRERLSENAPMLVGIDHGFSFPLQYFQENHLPFDWAAFLEDFQRHWPTDEDIYVDFVRDGSCGNASARSGSRKWRRLTEVRAGAAKSVFHFDVQGSVAKSTHAGLPWLRYLRLTAGGGVHFWPFDGWHIPAGRSVLAEVYPALWNRGLPREGRDSHQHDAYSIAAWMRRSDGEGSLTSFFHPHLEEDERKTAEIEGWILGVA